MAPRKQQALQAVPPEPPPPERVPIYLTVAIRTSGGAGPGVAWVPPEEAGRIITDRHGVPGEEPPRGFLDGGSPGSIITPEQLARYSRRPGQPR